MVARAPIHASVQRYCPDPKQGRRVVELLGERPQWPTPLSARSEFRAGPLPNDVGSADGALCRGFIASRLPRLCRRYDGRPLRIGHLVGAINIWPFATLTKLIGTCTACDSGLAAALTSWLWSQPLWLLVACTGLGLMLLGMALRHEA
jgi:hypothetical protein